MDRVRKASKTDLENAEKLEEHNEQRSEVLKRVVEWGDFVRTKQLSESEVGLLRDYDKQSYEDQKDLLEEQGVEYVGCFLSALDHINVPQYREYILALIAQLLLGHLDVHGQGGHSHNPQVIADRCRIFHQTVGEDGGKSPYAPFLRILSRNQGGTGTGTGNGGSGGSSPSSDIVGGGGGGGQRSVDSVFAVQEASLILAILFSHGEIAEVVVNGDMTSYISWLCDNLQVQSGRRLISTIQHLKVVLKNEQTHAPFYRHSTGLKSLIGIVRRETQNTQLLYVCTFCMWLLSYRAMSLQPFYNYDVAPRLITTLKTVLREKVVRVTLSTLVNLLELDEKRLHDEDVIYELTDSNGTSGEASASSSSASSSSIARENKGRYKQGCIAESLIGANAVSICASLNIRKWKDRDITSDLKIVTDRISRQFVEMSSFEKYVAEIQSGQFTWSPVHTEKFWRENNHRFEDDSYRYIDVLCSQFLNSVDPVTLEVACYDLGEFARFHPDGRRIIHKFGGKQKLMNRLNDEDKNISKQALLAVQKFMVTNWESLSRGVSAATGSSH